MSFSFAFLLIVFLNAAGIISFLIQVFVGIYVSSWILLATSELQDCCSLFSFGNKIKQIEICKLQFGMKNLWQIVSYSSNLNLWKQYFFLWGSRVDYQKILSASLDEQLFFVLLLPNDINTFQPPAFESEVAQRLSTPGVAVGEWWDFCLSFMLIGVLQVLVNSWRPENIHIPLLVAQG